MSGVRVHTAVRWRQRSIVGAMVLVVAIVGVPKGSATVAGAEVRSCSSGQLEVAAVTPNGADYAAGNVGIAFLIANTGASACSLEGYPSIRFDPSRYEGAIVKVAHGGGGIFVSVPVTKMIVDAGATASFGLDFGDAYDQQEPSQSACMTQSATVTLPVRPQRYGVGYDTNVGFNFCFAGFHVVVTAIQRGPTPRRA